MTDFHNVKLPDYIEIFALVNIEFSTICARTKSGREIRNILNNLPRRTYTLKDCCLSKTQFEVFNSFFYARCGQRFAFLFKDHCDFMVENQIISIGDVSENKFQLIKTYPDEISPYNRIITKPSEASIKIYVQGDLLKTNQFKQNEGQIILNDSIALDSPLRVNFEFYVPVRFAEDSFDYNFNHDGTILLKDVKLVEIL